MPKNKKESNNVMHVYVIIYRHACRGADFQQTPAVSCQ